MSKVPNGATGNSASMPTLFLAVSACRCRSPHFRIKGEIGHFSQFLEVPTNRSSDADSIVAYRYFGISKTTYSPF